LLLILSLPHKLVPKLYGIHSLYFLNIGLVLYTPLQHVHSLSNLYLYGQYGMVNMEGSKVALLVWLVSPNASPWPQGVRLKVGSLHLVSVLVYHIVSVHPEDKQAIL